MANATYRDLLVGLYSHLTADQTSGSFYDDLGGRIYLVEAPQDEALPLAIINTVDMSPDWYFNCVNVDAVIQIDLWADKHDTTIEALALTNGKLLELLDQTTVSATNHANVATWAQNRGTITIEGRALRIMSEWRMVGTITG